MVNWRDRVRQFKEQRERANEQDVPVTADEFLSADALDNELEADPEEALAMEKALELLRGQHLSFRKPDKEDVRDLEELRLEILTEMTTGSPELEEYYREAWRSDELLLRQARSLSSAIRRIVVMQIELMSRAFYALQLQLFANAPENHGWMTLFRSWGRSPRFNEVFAELEPTLSPQFTKFYSLYLRNLPARTSKHGKMPIHHPWLEAGTSEARGRGLCMDSGRAEGEIELEVRPGAGGVVDQRGSDKADQPFEKRSDSSADGGKDPAPNE